MRRFEDGGASFFSVLLPAFSCKSRLLLPLMSVGLYVYANRPWVRLFRRRLQKRALLVTSTQKIPSSFLLLLLLLLFFSSSSSSFTQLSCSLVQPFSSVLFFFFFFFFFLVVLLLQPVQLLLSLLCSVRLLFFFLPLLFSVQSGSVCTISDLGRKKERKKEGAVGESTRFINTQRSKSSDEKYEKTMFPFT
jgi:hypothetical protein